jgi:dUTP pyrophosphatase
MIKVKKHHELAKLPSRSNTTDAGADLYSVEEIQIAPLSRAIVGTGISIEIPDNTYGRIAPRSGLAAKYGIDVLAGVVDSEYRGEIKVVLYNTDKQKMFKVNIGDRIAQLIIESCQILEIIETNNINDTSRSNNGFGSSGIT